ncbi:MAG: efflux RND transporter periplasmic adaptor subunit [Phycisphaerales bacterium]|nr:MAG: efflux RND transporter periplasmic adaptor subunit [Phycisphaerales bacterium]
MAVVIVAALIAITFGLSRLEPGAPSVERASVWVGTVQRGEMVIEVRGPGSLVPERFWWVTASREGRVERIDVLPGTPVNHDTVLMVLSNPELEQSAVEAEYRLKSSEAEAAALEKRLESRLLDIEAIIATIEANLHEANLQGEVDEELHQSGDVSRLQWEFSKARIEQQTRLLAIQKRRLAVHRESAVTEMAKQAAIVEQDRALLQLRRIQVESLQVTAGFDGVLDQVAVEVGQHVMPGTTLARVINERQLKAVLRIPETQARDVQIGQRASVDTRNSVIEGVVSRIDPAVQDGTVTVDVRLLGELPRGARPDITVDGRIELNRLDDAIHVGRPVFAAANSLISLFRLDPDENTAVRVPVQLGATSVTTVEIVSGLEVGDQVILSDTSRYDDVDRIRLKE